MATEDLVQKAQGHGGHLVIKEDSPDGGEQQLVTHSAASRDVAMAARHAVTTLNSQASLLKSGATRLMAGGNVGGQVSEVCVGVYMCCACILYSVRFCLW